MNTTDQLAVRSTTPETPAAGLLPLMHVQQ